METEITKKYSNFRVTIRDKKLSDNEVEDILKNSVNSQELKSAWEGSKMIGPVVADDIIKLVKHRNTIAKKLGFGNYHEMSLKLSGQDPVEVTRIFDRSARRPPEAGRRRNHSSSQSGTVILIPRFLPQGR